ncbi:UTRA domain-containing protein [Asanoa siamensis]|uniref:UTRA domain-containing protein n=1 Tax=Asanoa siamensis TaxID=926357 RepID=UPI003570F9E9
MTRQRGREPRQSLDVSIVSPPPEVASRLRLKDGELTVVRRRVRYLDGEPYNTNDSYFPLSLLQDTGSCDQSTLLVVRMRYSPNRATAKVRALDEIYVRMPTPDEVRRLDLGPGNPDRVPHLHGSHYGRHPGEGRCKRACRRPPRGRI